MLYICAIYAHINNISLTNINQNTYIMIKVSEKIRELILTNNDFSLKLAQALQVTQQSVVSLAKRNSVKLTLYAAILLYKEEGFTDEEIFEDAYKKVENEL